MKYLQTKVNDSLLKVITIEDGSHFIPFKNYTMIKKNLLYILNN